MFRAEAFRTGRFASTCLRCCADPRYYVLTAALGRARPRISVLSSSDSMRFVTHATVQSCAAGARVTTTVDTSVRRIFTCTEKCGKSFDTKPKWTRHSKKCKGLKTCTVPNCSCPDFSGNIIGYVFEGCANLDRTAEKRNQLYAKAPERSAP